MGRVIPRRCASIEPGISRFRVHRGACHRAVRCADAVAAPRNNGAASRTRGAILPDLCMNLLPRKNKGAGKAGCPLHPQPRVRNKKAHEHSHHRFAGNAQLSLRNGFNGYFVLSPVTGLFCHRRLVELLPRNLTPASGRQDHTTSPSALVLFVDSTFASIASHLNVRDDRDTSLLSRRDGAKSAADLGVTATPTGCDRLARRAICAWHACTLCPSGKSVFAQINPGFAHCVAAGRCHKSTAHIVVM
jgi:hypothetical protein